MESKELIKALRCPYLGDAFCDKQECAWFSTLGCMYGNVVRTAADALEAAEKRIAELEAQIDELTTKRAVMDRREYELLQVELSKLLNKRLWCGRNEEQGYRNGVRAAKSKLKEVFYAQEEVQT